VGQGQGVIRIMEFGSAMSGGYRRDLAYWQGIAKDFLLPDAKDVMSLTMWKDTESTSFVVTESTFPRFFMSYFNSGLLRVALNLGGVRETSQSAYEGKVNSEETSWVFTFTTGYVVTLRGPLFVDLVARPTDDSEKYSLRFRRIKFNTSQVDKHLDIKQILGARRDGDPFSPRFQHHSYLTNGSLEGGSSNVSVSSTPGEEVRDDDPSQTKLPGDKWILLEKCWIPPDPVNSYGFTKVTERTLDVRLTSDPLNGNDR
ncbi:LIM-domain binding protein, partial [Cantharellus anzutake]|uniref:LIM-domain binding protein n=1 Tax=Cantharellus anzutake TaxID=1750568 RepID=UPI001902F7B7